MAHNDEAGDSSGLRSLQLSLDEADVLYWPRILVPLQFKLPHDWHLSNAGYAVPPLIAERRLHILPVERSQPGNAQNNPTWLWRFQDEHNIELARSARRDAGRFNHIGRQTRWHGRDVDTTFLKCGYRSRIHSIDPMRVLVYYLQA
jgi:hypothetical protein